MEPSRMITHLDLDAFFVSVELKKNSALQGKPLIVGGGDRGVVAACSYEARAFGVRSAMPIKMAKKLCPQATILKGDYEDYSKYSREVTAIIASKVPVYEKASIDEFYIDMSGMDKFFGNALFTSELKKKIVRETGLPITYAISTNKLVSKVATNEVKPDGQIEIPFGAEKRFLAPLAIDRMPGIGIKTGTYLKDRGIYTVQRLATFPKEIVESTLGKAGIDLWRKANGLDETPVVPYSEQKSISTENTFHTDTIDLLFMQKELVRMTEKIAFELRKQNKLAGCITIKLRYSDFQTYTKQKSIPYTSADHILLATVKEIFNKLYDRRLMVRLIGIRFTDLVGGNYQINLFEDTNETIRLYQALDSLHHKYGDLLVKRASGIP